MYLTDREITDRLAELSVETSQSVPFNADDQVQPCSIDLRLDPTYWTPRTLTSTLLPFRRTYTIDFAGSHFAELNPRRHWDRHVIEPGESLILRPGELALGRIYEIFTIPDDCAGRIEGRSSYARMGLTVHATGSFINPGWRGHMPLTLVNHGRFTLRIPAYLSVCQLMLIKLSNRPNQIYGGQSLHSKYVNDDGGPSYWWRDKMLSRLLEGLGRTHAGVEIQKRLLDRIGVPSDDVLERLERLVESQAYSSFGNTDELLHIFAGREDRQRMIDRTARLAMKAAFPIMLSLSLGSLFERPYDWLHYAIWLVTVLALPVTLLGVHSQPGDYLGRRELRDLERLRSGGRDSSDPQTGS